VECAYWTDRTAIAQYLTKGKQVFAEGQPEVRTYQKNDGTSGASLTMRVRDVQLLGGRGDGTAPAPGGFSGSASTTQSNIPAANEVNEPIDDLPF
jgi:single-strand DNA-binding protein